MNALMGQWVNQISNQISLEGRVLCPILKVNDAL